MPACKHCGKEIPADCVDKVFTTCSSRCLRKYKGSIKLKAMPRAIDDMLAASRSFPEMTVDQKALFMKDSIRGFVRNAVLNAPAHMEHRIKNGGKHFINENAMQRRSASN